MKTISVLCQKGGVGKSASTLALAAGFHDDGKRVLILDMDKQSNMSFACGCMNQKPSLRDVIKGRADIRDAIVSSPVGDIVPSDVFLSDEDLVSPSEIMHILKAVSRRYDVAVIDCPPSLGTIVVAALVASDYAVIPTQPNAFGYQGAKETLETVEALRSKGQAVQIAGILPTMVNPRTNIHKQFLSVLADLAAKHGTRLFDPIRSSTAIAEAAALQEPNFYQYAPRASAVQDYKNFYNSIKEILSDGN